MLNSKERGRRAMFEEVRAGRLSVAAAARALGLSYRHARRLYGAFVAQGEGALAHKGRGRCSNRGQGPAVKAAVLARYAERYEGFGATLAAEKLALDGWRVDHETLRRWLLAAGLLTRRRRWVPHRSRRPRRAAFGELVQLDGSHHAWFGPGYPPACLMNAVDDASSTTYGLMATGETTEVAMQLLMRWIRRYGVPQALYTDQKNIFIATREPTREEQLAGITPLTPFGQACARLGIAIIGAHSPQAKGRVERSHAVYQDRFVKELALQGRTTIPQANALLETFCDELNARFAIDPATLPDAHRPLAPGVKLDDVFCYEDTRVLANDFTVSYQGRILQILASNRPRPKPRERLVVRRWLDGSLHLYYHDAPLAFEELPVRPRPPAPPPKPPAPPKARAPKPAPDHPWRRRAGKR